MFESLRSININKQIKKMRKRITPSTERIELVETKDINPCIKGRFFDDGKVSVYENYIVYVPVGTIKEAYSANLNTGE